MFHKILITTFILQLGIFSYGQKNDDGNSCDRQYFSDLNSYVTYKDSVKFVLCQNLDNRECCGDTLKIIQTLIKSTNKKEFGSYIYNDVEHSFFKNNTDFVYKSIPKFVDSTKHLSLYKTSKTNQLYEPIPIKVLYAYYICSLFEGSFQFRDSIELTYKGREISVLKIVNEGSVCYEIVGKRYLNKIDKELKRWYSKTMSFESIEDVRKIYNSPLGNDFNWK